MSSVNYKDCIKIASSFVQLDEIILALDKPLEERTLDENQTIDRLVSCADLVLNEIACDYIPLKKTEKITTQQSRIYFRNLEKNIVDIFSVESNGVSVPFVPFHDCILMPYEGSFTVTYSYTPLKGTLETNLEWDSERVNERIVAYGIACEYCLMNGLSEDASLFDKRFKDALFKGASVKSERIIKRRRWL